MTKRILLDTDPGIDDSLAILLALASPELALEGLVTVHGNCSLKQATTNGLAVLELAHAGHIPLAQGCELPLVQSSLLAAETHGATGLGYAKLPVPLIQPIGQHGCDFLIEQVLANPGEFTLVAIGPLTNVALAIRQEPRFVNALKELIIMGGAIRHEGNQTALAEFNTYVDPHAAHIVYHSGMPITLELVASGLTAPLKGTTAPGLPDYLFVVDQVGSVWAVNLQTNDRTLFLDVSARLVPLGVLGADTFDERGLLGLAFHPDYPANGKLYTFTSEPTVGPPTFATTMPPDTTADHQNVAVGLSHGTALGNIIVSSRCPVAPPMLIHPTVTITGDKSLLGACEARLRRLLSAQFLKNEVTEHHGARALCYDLKVEGGIPFPVFAQASQEFPGLEIAAEWVNVAAGEKGAATIVNGRVSAQTTDRIALRAGGEHPLYVEVAASGRLALALAVVEAAILEERPAMDARDGLLRAHALGD